MFTEITIVGGVFWTITYLLIIRRGFKDKTFGMPMAAVCANISWEIIFSFFIPHDSPQIYINYIWLALDAVIVIQFLKYGKKEFPSFANWQFYGSFALGLSITIPMILTITDEFGDGSGAFVAFGQNLMMSVLFVMWLFNRQGISGQSFYIALFKLIGTVPFSVAFYLYRPIAQDSYLLQFLFVAIFVFDLIYTIGIYRKCKRNGISLKQF